MTHEAGAQADSHERRIQLLQQLPPGIRLRVQAANETTVGRLRTVTADSIVLDSRSFAISDLERGWIQQRSTRKGRNIGALVGAPAGGLFGLFIVWLADALCENSCGDLTAGELALGTVGFAAFGFVSGGALGAVIGAGIPRWGEVTDGRTRVPSDPDAPIGSFSIAPAYAQFAQSEDGGGGGGRATYTFETKNLAVGLEAGRYTAGTIRQQVFNQCPGGTACFDTADVKTSVLHAGGVVRFVPGGPRGTRPYASIGLGLYDWDSGSSGSITLAGYSLGAGVQVRNSTGRRALFADARWQNNLSRSGNALPRYGFYTIAIGTTFAW